LPDDLDGAGFNFKNSSKQVLIAAMQVLLI